MDRCKFAAAVATAVLWLAGTVQGAFTTVINSPPDVFVPGEVVVSDTQINLFEGSTYSPGKIIFLGDDGVPAENVELNVLGGEVWAVQAWDGSQLNVASGSMGGASLLGSRATMTGGEVQHWSLFSQGYLAMSGGRAAQVFTAGSTGDPEPDSALFVMTGGEVGLLDATGNVVVTGGAIESMVFRGAGFVEISGGTIGDDFEVGGVGIGADPDDPTREIVDGASGHVTVRGGSIGERMVLRTGRTLDYAGGVIGDALQALEGSQVLIRGTQFFVDGVEVSWPAGGWHVVTQRDIELTGLLASGESFRFDLNSLPGQGDYFSSGATVAVLLVPEPGTAILAILSVPVVGPGRLALGRRITRR